MALNKQGGPRR